MRTVASAQLRRKSSPTNVATNQNRPAAAQASAAILAGVRAGKWRVLVGDDAVALRDMPFNNLGLLKTLSEVRERERPYCHCIISRAVAAMRLGDGM